MHELRQAFVASNHINVTASALSDDKMDITRTYTRKLCYRKDDRAMRAISRSWAVAEIWPFEIIQDGGVEIVRIEK